MCNPNSNIHTPACALAQLQDRGVVGTEREIPQVGAYLLTVDGELSVFDEANGTRQILTCNASYAARVIAHGGNDMLADMADRVLKAVYN